MKNVSTRERKRTKQKETLLDGKTILSEKSLARRIRAAEKGHLGDLEKLNMSGLF